MHRLADILKTAGTTRRMVGLQLRFSDGNVGT
jgi:hypothetical protein